MYSSAMVRRVVILPEVQHLVPGDFEARAWQVLERLPQLWDHVAAAPLFRPTARGREYVGPRWVFIRGEDMEMLSLSFEEMLGRYWHWNSGAAHQSGG